jgi:hypothetical protein
MCYNWKIDHIHVRVCLCSFRLIRILVFDMDTFLVHSTMLLFAYLDHINASLSQRCIHQQVTCGWSCTRNTIQQSSHRRHESVRPKLWVTPSRERQIPTTMNRMCLKSQHRRINARKPPQPPSGHRRANLQTSLWDIVSDKTTPITIRARIPRYCIY